MKPVYFLIMLIFLLGCKKETVEPYQPLAHSEPKDFNLVATKNAKWYVNIITDVNCFPYLDPNDMDLTGMTDMLWTYQYVIEATGCDTGIDGYIYHVYNITLKQSEPTYGADEVPYTYTSSGKYLLREDTVAKKLYRWHSKNVIENEGYLVADFSDEANKGQAQPFPSWREMNIVKSGGYYLGGQDFKSWDMQNVQDANYSYFYKALGIGTAKGIVPSFDVNGMHAWQVTSLDFVYRGDSVHFDFPLQ